MKTSRGISFIILVPLLWSATISFGQHIDIKPPVAKMIPKVDTLHGDIRTDNYFWLCERNNPEVVAYLKAENAYTDTLMKPTVAFQETLYTEMLRRIKETDEEPPYPQGNYYYYTRTEKGKQYPLYCRKNGSLSAPEEIYFDQNEMAQGLSFYNLWSREVNLDGSLFAFSVDTNGSENYILQMKDLSDGRLLSDKAQNIQHLVWAADHRTLLYTVEDSTKRPYRVYRHLIGTPQSDDPVIYEESDPLYNVEISRSLNQAYIFITSSASNSNEWWYLPADVPAAKPQVITLRRPEHEYSVDQWGDYFYIRTNTNAKSFRLVRVSVAKPSEKNWEEVLPYRPGITLEGIGFFSHHMVVYEREKGLQKIRVSNMDNASIHYIDFPDPVYSAFANVNAVFDTKIFRYSYQSLTRPYSIFDYNLDTKERTLIKQQEVLGGYDPAQYVSERIFAKAEDGTEVPISLVYKRGARSNGPAPLHMTGYGAYGSSMEPTFSSNRLSFLDRGVIVALAHVRGGGDMGREWYDDGKLLEKKNTFTDFIACTQHLIRENYTTEKLMTISGGSAGGLLIGAVTNMRPDLFKAVIARVPFVDVLNTMLNPGLMYTTTEYLEWGNPNDKMYYDYIKSYCPYSNVKEQHYPNILIKVGFNDSRVNYWEGTKWAAKLRAMKKDNNIVMVKATMGAGHMGSSGRYERLKENAFDYAFVLMQYGMLK